MQATVVRAQKPTSAHAGDTALVRADGIDRRLRRRHLRGGVGARVRADDAVDQRAAAAADRPRRGAPAGAEEGAVDGRQPVPVRRGGGDLPRAAACRRRGSLVVGDSPIAQALVDARRPARLRRRARRRDQAEPAAGRRRAGGRLARPRRGAGADRGAAARACRTSALVASRIRGAAVLAALDVTDEQRGRVHSPAGLDIGGADGGGDRAVGAGRAGAGAAGRGSGTPAAPAAPATAVDPVCGMTVAAVDGSLHADRRRRPTWFCCAGCRTAFVADPARYAAAS